MCRLAAQMLDKQPEKAEMCRAAALLLQHLPSKTCIYDRKRQLWRYFDAILTKFINKMRLK